jgi:hypothetical protein
MTDQHFTHRAALEHDAQRVFLDACAHQKISAPIGASSLSRP